MKCKILFSRKNEKILQKVLMKFLPSIQSVNLATSSRTEHLELQIRHYKNQQHMFSYKNKKKNKKKTNTWISLLARALLLRSKYNVFFHLKGLKYFLFLHQNIYFGSTLESSQ